jgi:hypothetical protein
MKTSEIEVGKTYVNRGKGTTKRTVLAIGDEHRPKHFFGATPPNEPGVLYEQSGALDYLYLSSFAAWAGRQLK